MSDDDLVTIGTYGTPNEAHFAKSILADEEIPACVGGDSATTWLWHVGTALGGTKVQVARRDAERAAAVLREREGADEAGESAAWICPQCRAEVDGDFEVCWSCQAERDGEADGARGERPATLQEESDEGPASEQPEPKADADARRAWRASVLGLLFPPLILYVMYLLLKITHQELSPRAMRQFFGALAISVGSLVFWYFCWRLI